MLLSIVIPVYNVEKYIGISLDSCLHQNVDVNEYEILCVDDGSTDRSAEILDEYSKKYNNVKIIHKENGGVSSARNTGINNSKGQYIWFVDSDDIISYNSLNDIFQALYKYMPDLLYIKPVAFEDADDISSFKSNDVVENESTKEYWDWLWTRIYKREIILNSGVLFNEKISIAEDHMFCTMLNPYINEIKHLDKVIYGYRKRSNSLSSTITAKKLHFLIDSTKEFYDAGLNGKIDYQLAMDTVYENMISIMGFLSTLPHAKEKVIIQELKAKKLFPIKLNSEISPVISSDVKKDNRILMKLKYKSYTYFGYRKLRMFRFYLKVKRRFFK